MTPNQCPFAREIRILGCKVAQIPPLCKLNPLYPELMKLRFRALCYLADECNEDISAYCSAIAPHSLPVSPDNREGAAPVATLFS